MLWNSFARSSCTKSCDEKRVTEKHCDGAKQIEETESEKSRYRVTSFPYVGGDSSESKENVKGNNRKGYKAWRFITMMAMN